MLALGAEELVELLLRQERNLQTLRLLVLAAWISTGDNIVCLAGDTGGDASPGSGNEPLRLLTREVRQRAGEHEHFASQYLGGGRAGVGGCMLLQRHAGIA